MHWLRTATVIGCAILEDRAGSWLPNISPSVWRFPACNIGCIRPCIAADDEKWEIVFLFNSEFCIITFLHQYTSCSEPWDCVQLDSAGSQQGAERKAHVSRWGVIPQAHSTHLPKFLSPSQVGRRRLGKRIPPYTTRLASRGGCATCDWLLPLFFADERICTQALQRYPIT